MNVLVNGRPLSSVLTGIARYTRSLYESMARLDGVTTYYYCNGKVRNTMPSQSKDLFSNKFSPWVRHLARISRQHFDNYRLQQCISGNQLDLYHETGFISVSNRRSVPTVLTIYDLSLLTHPQFHPPDRVKQFEQGFFKSITRADHVIAISKFVRDEIIEFTDIPADKVTAIPLAVCESLSNSSDADSTEFLENNELLDGYILSVGTREPRKNLSGLLQAYSLTDTPYNLVIAGWSGWMSEGLFGEIQLLGLQGRVQILGHVSDKELAALYRGARAMVYPSFYEGFGLPILEAMSCGCPVICSNVSSMPEVAGDAAILVDPNDIDQIASSISQVADDEKVRHQQIEKGYENAKKFSWHATASQTLQVFREAINS